MKLIYASCPARLADKKDEIMRYIDMQGAAGLHPFNAFPYEYFEGGSVGREKTLAMCCKLIDACDEFWVFGISEGVLFETAYLLKTQPTKPIKVVIQEFDTDWKTYYEKFKPDYHDALERLVPYESA